jgi:hypothetical protein
MVGKKKIRKGVQVRIATECSDWTNVTDQIWGSRPVTPEEVEAWRNSPRSRGLNDAGETRLPPRSTSFRLSPLNSFTVLRARCRPQLGWGNPCGGMVYLHDPESGEDLYVHRRYLIVVE